MIKLVQQTSSKPTYLTLFVTLSRHPYSVNYSHLNIRK